jgi:hypothetical protein
MNNLFATTVLAGAMATAALGAAGLATAAVPSEPSKVTTTINGLKASGYDVIVNRVGAAPMSECVVSAVRPGHQLTRTDSGVPGDSLTTTVLSETMYVDVTC